jgi:hypothetical protein
MPMDLSDAAWRGLIGALHASGRKAALAITGGGSGAIAELLRVPGGSRLLVEAQVPYDEQALAAYLGDRPAQFSSAETAAAMARTARLRAMALLPPGSAVVGLGATAALVSDRPRRGEHRIHIAAATEAGIAHASATLAKGARDRAGEEDLASRLIVLWLARACGVEAPSPAALLGPDEAFTTGTTAAGDAIDLLLAGSHPRVTAQPDGQLTLAAPPPPVVLPGSFNPLHHGHETLAQLVQDMRQAPVSYEISVTNVDKPPLPAAEVRGRVAQFAWKAPVELTAAPTFLEKSRLFPGAAFVIGVDTAERLVAPRYYGHDETRMHDALDTMGRAGHEFLVAARAADGALRTLRDVTLPRRYVDLFREIPGFRVDVSSTELRKQRK